MNIERGSAGLAALRRLANDPHGIQRCVERILEKLLRHTLNDLPALAEHLTPDSDSVWYAGAAGYLPDLVAWHGQDDSSGLIAGVEVKTRADINWGYYGTDVWQSQLDRYATRSAEFGEPDLPLYLLVDVANKASVKKKLAATGEQKIFSRDRWTVITLSELLDNVPESDSTTDDPPAVSLLLLMLGDA